MLYCDHELRLKFQRPTEHVVHSFSHDLKAISEPQRPTEHGSSSTGVTTRVLVSLEEEFSDVSVLGIHQKDLKREPLQINGIQSLHGTLSTIRTGGRYLKDIPPPPIGVFQWHYLQCVLRIFGTFEYRTFPNISW